MSEIPIQRIWRKLLLRVRRLYTTRGSALPSMQTISTRSATFRTMHSVTEWKWGNTLQSTRKPFGEPAFTSANTSRRATY